MNKSAYAILSGACALLAMPAALAQSFPSQLIEIIVPYAAGGGTDLSVRITAEILQKHLPGSTVIVVNRPGGGGAIGTAAALNAEPTGYTLGTGAQGPVALLPHYGATDYTIDDIEFIGMMGRNLQVVVACADAPFSTFDAFLTYAKDNPGSVMIGNSGAGGANHLAVEAFSKAADITVENVPFGGASEALTTCAGGHIHATTATPAEVTPHIEAGSMTALFIMEPERIDTMPDVPTAVEHGVDFTWSSWKGIIGPKGLPDDVKATLIEAIEATFTDPEFVRRMEEMNEFVEYRDPAGYEELARSDSATAEQVIRDLGMYGMNAP